MKFRNIMVCLLCLLLILGFTACDGQASKNSAGSVGSTGDYIAKEEAPADQGNTTAKPDNSTVLPENRKLIQTVHLSVETENLDTVLQQIDDRIAQLGGYMESSNVQNGSAYSGKRYRNATLTVRIPAKDLDAFLDKVGEVTNIVSSRKTVEDVTLSYVATESRMKALQTEETRLLELLAKAESLEDLLTIEKRLTEVRTELEQVTSALKVLDNQVDYATIHLSVNEVKEFTDVTEPETVWQRISRGFSASLKGLGTCFVEMFVFLVIALPYLVVAAAITLGTLWVVKVARKGKKTQAEKEEKQPEEQKEQNS